MEEERAKRVTDVSRAMTIMVDPSRVGTEIRTQLGEDSNNLDCGGAKHDDNGSGWLRSDGR